MNKVKKWVMEYDRTKDILAKLVLVDNINKELEIVRKELTKKL